MPIPAHIAVWKIVPPTESNGYCLFRQELEDDPLVLFHLTPADNLASIASSGFRSAKDLGLGALSSVSYAKRSSGCVAHIGNAATRDYVVLAVRFDTLDRTGIEIQVSDAYVYDSQIQPHILGYCEIPTGFRVQ